MPHAVSLPLPGLALGVSLRDAAKVRPMDGAADNGQMAKIGQAARAAAAELAFASAERKQAALIGAAEAVWARRSAIIEANAEDQVYGEEKGLSRAMMDRLTLNEGRVRAIVDGLRAVAGQKDPVGEVIDIQVRPRAEAGGRMPPGSLADCRKWRGSLGVAGRARPKGGFGEAQRAKVTRSPRPKVSDKRVGFMDHGKRPQHGSPAIFRA